MYIKVRLCTCSQWCMTYLVWWLKPGFPVCKGEWGFLISFSVLSRASLGLWNWVSSCVLNGDPACLVSPPQFHCTTAIPLRQVWCLYVYSKEVIEPIFSETRAFLSLNKFKLGEHSFQEAALSLKPDARRFCIPAMNAGLKFHIPWIFALKWVHRTGHGVHVVVICHLVR